MKRSFSNLTDAYLKAAEGEFASLPLGADWVPLDRVYVQLEALAAPKPCLLLEPRPDLPDSPERQAHAGLADLLGEPGSGKSATLQFIGKIFQ